MGLYDKKSRVEKSRDKVPLKRDAQMGCSNVLTCAQHVRKAGSSALSIQLLSFYFPVTVPPPFKGTVARDFVWLKVVPFDRYKQGELPLKVLKFLNYSFNFILKFKISSHYYENQFLFTV